jgi:tRNA modification GTPase
MDIIDAESEAALRISGASGRGRLTDEVQSMYDSLKHLIAATYAYIDYPDEDMTDITVEQMKEELQDLLGRAYRLKESRKTSYAVCDGVRTVICGKPNVGKSSLLNLFTGKETAIVTEIPGTTRDIVKDSVMCGDVKLRLYDTAGIRDTDDTVEKIGVERAKTALSEAKLVLAVFDSSRPKDKEDEELVKELSKITCPVIGVINKSDENRFSSDYEGLFSHEVKISAKTGEGKSELEKIIVDLFLSGGINYDLPHIANDRQYSELLRFISSAENALQTLKSGQTQDIACLDLEDALAALAELDGLEVTDDIVNEIFTKFCVGK